MNYERLYFAFIEKYKNQKFDDGVYTEVHHIIPRHAGGDDSRENLIRLDYKQHTFAHHILWKVYKKSGDYCAWLMMSGQEADQKLANLKAIGKAHVESGHLDAIRHMANTPIQREHARGMCDARVACGLHKETIRLANEAWRGGSHTDKYKATKSVQMKEYLSKPDVFEKQMVYCEMGRKVKTENAERFSQEVINNAERNEEFLQEISSRSLNKFVSPEGLEFDSPIFAASYYGGVKPHVVENWCKRGKYGWSRRLKAA